MPKVPVLLAILLSPFLLKAATFGPEMAVAPPQYSSAFGAQTASSVACDGQSCVALWTESDDARRGLYSSVIDANGNVHPPSSNVVRAGYEVDASIVWTGDHYMAAWFDLDSSTFLAAPLSRDGQLAGAIQNISAVNPSAGGTALAWNGRHAFVVFNKPGKLEAAILNPDGSVVRSLVLPPAGVRKMAAAAAGQTFAAVWVEPFQSTATVEFQRFADDGSLIDAEPVKLAENLTLDFATAGIAGNAAQFGVAYAQAVDSSLYRVRIDASTGAIERLRIVPFGRVVSGVYWSGDDFVAYGGDVQTIATERFSFDALSVLRVSTASPVLDASIAAGPAGAVAIWTDTRPGFPTQHGFGALTDRDATTIVKGDIPISVSALPQTYPALAPSSDGALLAWSQPRDPTAADVVVRRLNAEGAPADAAPVVLASNVPYTAPAAVWLGNSYLVTWTKFESGEVIVGKRVSPSGVVLDASPIEYGPGFAPRLISNGTTTILVFQGGTGVAYLRLNANGQPLDSQPINISSENGRGLAVASNASQFLVAWTEGNNDPDFPIGNLRDIDAVCLTAAGLPIDSAPIPIANSARDEHDPAVASDGRDFLIAYTDGKIVTRRLLAEGSLAGTSQDEGMVVDANGGVTPAIAWIGSEYVLTWVVPDSQGSTIVGTTVDRTGAPLDLARTIGRSESHFNVQTAVAAIDGAAIAAYSRGDAAEKGIPLLFTRHVTSGPPRGRGVRH